MSTEPKQSENSAVENRPTWARVRKDLLLHLSFYALVLGVLSFLIWLKHKA